MILADISGASRTLILNAAFVLVSMPSCARSAGIKMRSKIVTTCSSRRSQTPRMDSGSLLAPLEGGCSNERFDECFLFILGGPGDAVCGFVAEELSLIFEAAASRVIIAVSNGDSGGLANRLELTLASAYTSALQCRRP